MSLLCGRLHLTENGGAVALNLSSTLTSNYLSFVWSRILEHGPEALQPGRQPRHASTQWLRGEGRQAPKTSFHAASKLYVAVVTGWKLLSCVCVCVCAVLYCTCAPYCTCMPVSTCVLPTKSMHIQYMYKCMLACVDAFVHVCVCVCLRCSSAQSCVC